MCVCCECVRIDAACVIARTVNRHNPEHNAAFPELAQRLEIRRTHKPAEAGGRKASTPKPQREWGKRKRKRKKESEKVRQSEIQDDTDRLRTDCILVGSYCA